MIEGGFDEREALRRFLRRVHFHFAIRLAAMEGALAAVLADVRPGWPGHVAAVVVGSALVAVSLHRLQVRRLRKTIEESQENQLVVLDVLTDLSADREARRSVPINWVTAGVVGMCLVVIVATWV